MARVDIKFSDEINMGFCIDADGDCVDKILFNKEL